MNWIKIIKDSKDALLRKKNFWIFILFLMSGAWFLSRFIDSIFILFYLMIMPHGLSLPQGISIETAISLISYISLFVTMSLLVITLVIEGGFLHIISGKENSVIKSMKYALFRSKDIIGVVLLIVLIQYVANYPYSLNTAEHIDDVVAPEIQAIIMKNASYHDEIIQNIAGLFSTGNFLQILGNFGKPSIIAPPLVKDFCMLDASTCWWSVSKFYIGFPLLQIFIYMLISIFTLFVMQEIILNNAETIQSIKNSIVFVRRNMDEVIILYILSLLSFVIFAGAGALISSVLSSILGLFSVLFYHIFLTIGFMYVIALQTAFYLEVKNR